MEVDIYMLTSTLFPTCHFFRKLYMFSDHKVSTLYPKIKSISYFEYHTFTCNVTHPNKCPAFSLYFSIYIYLYQKKSICIRFNSVTQHSVEKIRLSYVFRMINDRCEKEIMQETESIHTRYSTACYTRRFSSSFCVWHISAVFI